MFTFGSKRISPIIMVKILYKSLFDGKSKFLDIETTNPEDILNEIREKEVSEPDCLRTSRTAEICILRCSLPCREFLQVI